jgi:hypothetical protein
MGATLSDVAAGVRRAELLQFTSVVSVKSAAARAAALCRMKASTNFSRRLLGLKGGRNFYRWSSMKNRHTPSSKGIIKA